MTKVLAIIRVSTIQQEMESQKEEMRIFLRDLGYKEDDIFWLEAKGASARKCNKKYLEFFGDIKRLTQDIKVVAVWHLNRLARIESKLMELKEYFINNSIQVYVKNPNIKLLDEDGKPNATSEITWSIYGTMVKLETDEMFAKMKRGKNYKKSQGKYIGGGILFGCKVVDEYVVPDEKIIPDVIKMFQNYVDGYSLPHLRDYMWSLGYTMCISQINKSMRNPKYREIIGDELYDAYLLEKDRRNKLGFAPKERTYRFGEQLLYCPKCSARMYYQGSTKAGVYRCANTIKNLSANQKARICDSSFSVTSYRMDCMLMESAFFWYNKFTKENGSKRLQDINSQMQDLSKQIEVIQAKIDDTQSVIDRITDSYITGLITKKKRDAKIQDVLHQKTRLISECNDYKARLKYLQEEADSLKKNIITVQDNDREVESMTKIDRYNLIHQMISRVEFEVKDKSRIIIIHSKVFDDCMLFKITGRGRTYKLFRWYKDHYEDVTDVYNFNVRYDEMYTKNQTILNFNSIIYRR